MGAMKNETPNAFMLECRGMNEDQISCLIGEGIIDG